MNTEVAMFWFSVIVVTAILIWGFKLVNGLLRSVPDETKPRQTFLGRAMSEKTVVDKLSTPAAAQTRASADIEEVASYSRVSGAIGSIILAAMLAGVGYYFLYALFFKPEGLKVMNDLWLYFAAGAALFAPYAVNQLSSIFK